MVSNILIDKELHTLSLYQRGVLALKEKAISDLQRQKKRDSKKQWIAKARAIFTPGEKQPCIVCGKYKSVAHAHHLTPLHTQYGKPTFSEEFAWLCPTHHDGVHRLIDGSHAGRWPSMDGFSESEQLQMTRIAAMGF